jgi:hypothetical protein
MSRSTRRVLAAGGVGVALLLAVPAALAHQTVTSNGVSVTVHVAPDDEPQAGKPAQFTVVKVKRKGWRFRIGHCGCRLKIVDAEGRKVFDRPVNTTRTRVTFPRAAAYQVTFSGHVTRKGHRRSFAAGFAYRAS